MAEDKDLGLTPDNTPNSPLDTLSQDLERMLEDLRIQEAKSLATREYITNSGGGVMDVRLSQNGQSATLKQFYPGDYSIVLSENSQDERYNPKRNILFIPRNTPRSLSDDNLTLLHEAGHAVDEAENRLRYQKMDAHLFALNYEQRLCKLRLASSEKLKEEDLEDALRFMGYSMQGYSVELMSSAAMRVTRSFQAINEIEDPERIKDRLESAKRKHNQILTKKKAEAETNAWIKVLDGLLFYENRGITLFNGSKDRLRKEIEKSLSGYKLVHAKYLTPKHSFSLPDHVALGDLTEGSQETN